MLAKYHWPIIGHENLKKYFKNQIDKGDLPHAMVFLGPNNVGKRYLATLFAKSLFCENKSQKPCLDCPKCKQASNGTSSEFILIEKELEAKKISIKQIRDLQKKLSLKSFNTNYKTIIINNAEELNEEANNALLKTLEEPHDKTIFILITNHSDNLPATIISRCQEIYFNPVPDFQIENWLISLKYDKVVSKNAASISMGRPGLALQYVQNKEEYEQNQELVKNIIQVMKLKPVTEKFNLMSYYLKKSTSLDEYRYLLNTWETLIRDYYLIRSNNNISNRRLMSLIKKDYLKYNVSKLINIHKLIINAKELINRSINPILVMENLLINI